MVYNCNGGTAFGSSLFGSIKSLLLIFSDLHQLDKEIIDIIKNLGILLSAAVALISIRLRCQLAIQHNIRVCCMFYDNFSNACTG